MGRGIGRLGGLISNSNSLVAVTSFETGRPRINNGCRPLEHLFNGLSKKVAIAKVFETVTIGALAVDRGGVFGREMGLEAVN